MDAIEYLLSECARLGVSPSKLYKFAKKSNTKHWPIKDRKKLRWFLSKGWGRYRIAKAMGKNPSSVGRAIAREIGRKKNVTDREVLKAPTLDKTIAAIMAAGLEKGERRVSIRQA